jgi:hypothetical protein
VERKGYKRRKEKKKVGKKRQRWEREGKGGKDSAKVDKKEVKVEKEK